MGRLRMMGAKVPSLDTRIAQPSPKIVDPFYLSPEWRGLMARIIKQRGRRCEDRMCKTPGRTGMRVFGDHVIELKDGGAPLDEGNVLLRCGSCHTRKTAEARAARAMR